MQGAQGGRGVKGGRSGSHGISMRIAESGVSWESGEQRTLRKSLAGMPKAVELTKTKAEEKVIKFPNWKITGGF